MLIRTTGMIRFPYLPRSDQRRTGHHLQAPTPKRPTLARWRCLGIAVLSACAFSGCSTAPRIQDEAEVGILRTCIARNEPGIDANSAAADEGPLREELRGMLSEQSLAVAAAIGALPTLRLLIKAPPEDRIARIEARQRLLELLWKASIEVTATMTEIDCEGERGDRLRDQLVDFREKELRRAALTGLVAGAVTSVLGGTLALTSAAVALQAGVDVVGGVVEASASATTLRAAPTARLRTERNLLAEVWQDSGRSALMRDAIWRYLTDPNPRAAPYRTIRDSLKAEWIAGGRLGAPDSPLWQRRTALLFGTGGYYDADDLQARDSILDLLEATVGRMTADLEALMREVQRSW